MRKTSILIVVENLPVPLDRRVWQESLALRDAGYQVIVICPQMHGQTAAEETLDGIVIYRICLRSVGRDAPGLESLVAASVQGDPHL